MGEALGATGIHVREPAEIAPAIARARQLNDEGKVVVIEAATCQEKRFSQYESLLTT